MLSTILGGLFLILLVVLTALLYWDERSSNARHVPCELTDGTVVQVKVIHRSATARLLQWITRDTYTLTVWNRVYVAGYWLVPRGLRHEIEHVRQWHDHGIFFPIVYVYWWVRGGSFDKNPLEIDARLAAGQPESGRRR